MKLAKNLEITVRVLGRPAREMLQGAGQLTVLGVTSRGAFLQTAAGSVCFLSQERWRGPLTANLRERVSLRDCLRVGSNSRKRRSLRQWAEGSSRQPPDQPAGRGSAVWRRFRLPGRSHRTRLWNSPRSIWRALIPRGGGGGAAWRRWIGPVPCSRASTRRHD